MTIDARAFRAEGREAFEVHGRSDDENPYAGGDQAQFDLWCEGHLEGRGNMIRAMLGSRAHGVAMDALCERCRQIAKWGEKDHDHGLWVLILLEELGEAAEASLEGDAHGYRRELVQAAAVVLAMIEAHDRARERRSAS